MCAAQLTPWGYRPCSDASVWGVRSRTALWGGWGSRFGSVYLALLGPSCRRLSRSRLGRAALCGLRTFPWAVWPLQLTCVYSQCRCGPVRSPLPCDVCPRNRCCLRCGPVERACELGCGSCRVGGGGLVGVGGCCGWPPPTVDGATTLLCGCQWASCCPLGPTPPPLAPDGASVAGLLGSPARHNEAEDPVGR